jgi:hypothetical protein
MPAIMGVINAAGAAYSNKARDLSRLNLVMAVGELVPAVRAFNFSAQAKWRCKYSGDGAIWKIES